MAPSFRPSLPQRQLIVLAACRFCQPFAIASVFAYFPEYIEYLGVNPSKVSIWVGILAAAFNAGECLSAFPWTYLADRWGRRPVLVTTLLLALIANLSIGLCSSIPQAFICILVAGITNGNVAVMRTVVAELVPAKELQAKAFAYLPTASGLGTVLGPFVGGNLASLADRHPSVFGKWALLKAYPFALPAAISALIFFPALLASLLTLEETLHSYERLPTSADDEDNEEARESGDEIELVKNAISETRASSSPDGGQEDYLNQGNITTSNRWAHVRNVAIWINAICGLHVTAFDHMLPVFLYQSSNRDKAWSILKFSFGFGKSSPFIGTLLTVAGVFGMATTIVAVPRLISRLGDRGVLRIGMFVFPVIYTLFPWSAIPSYELLRIISLVVLLLVKVALSVSALQSCLILITNSVSKQDLAGAHGVNFAIASTARGIGSFSSGLLFSYGMQHNLMVLPFWTLGLWSLVNLVLIRIVKD